MMQDYADYLDKLRTATARGEKTMSERNASKTEKRSSEPTNVSISIGKIKKNSQVTVKDTGWSEEEKERMQKSGYDDMDMVRAWYS